MQVRRRLSLLERPVSSSASLGRRWFGYGPYKPEVGRDKQTTAMRLGLAKGKIIIENIIYYH
jgi:hypothetical protein